jgi:glycerol kinase
MHRASSYLVAIDQGTTSSRALVLDGRGRVAGSSQGDFKIPGIHPRPGWVEFDPRALWATVRDAVASALDHAGVAIGQVAALGMANQGETVIAFDGDSGAPFGNAISWQDRRTEDIVAGWRADGLERQVHAITGLRLDPYFSAAKLAWILAHRADAAEALDKGRLRLGTSDTWLIWQLTGGRSFVTDAATASRTMLMDLEQGAWSQPLVEALGLPGQSLPAIVASAGLLGVTDSAVWGRQVPITGLCVDQHAALFGHGCHERHQAKATYGTGCFVVANAGTDARVRAPGLLTALGWRLGQSTHYIVEGGVYSAGSIVEWLIGLGLITAADELDGVAGSVADSRGVVMIPAFSGLAAPWWQSNARACWAGMDSGTSRAHLVRAALESIAFRVRDIHAAMAEAGVALGSLRADGGLTRSQLLMQLQADALDCPVAVSVHSEVTALGVGLMAGLGAGIWDSVAELPEVAATGARFEPRVQEARHAAAMYRRWRALCESVARWA